MLDALANVKLSDVLIGKPVGRPKNSHVIKHTPQKPLNTEKMRRMIHGAEKK